MADTDLVTEQQVNALIAAIASSVNDALQLGETVALVSLDALGGPVLRFELTGSDGNSPNAFEMSHAGELTSYFNEFGELRGRPSADNRVAARWFGNSNSQSANILEVMDRKATPRVVVFSIAPDGTVEAPNVQDGVVAYDNTTTPDPTGYPTNTIFIGFDPTG